MKILLVEDDIRLRSVIKDTLKKEGYTVAESDNGEEGLFQMMNNASDLVVLDWMLPDMDGITVLKQARAASVSVPVIMLTAMSAIGDKITGLDSGADDYISKPFDTGELLARIRALLRRPAAIEEKKLCFGDITIVPSTMALKGPSDELPLTEKEYAIMELLIDSAGKVITRQLIFNRVWGPDAEVEDGNMDSYIYFLRRRLKAVGAIVELATKRGVGFMLVQPNKGDMACING